MKRFLPAAAGIWLAVQGNPATAETEISAQMEARTGYSTNLFADANELRGGFTETGATLKVTTDQGGWRLVSELSRAGRMVEGRDYGSETVFSGAAELTVMPTDTSEITLSGALQRADAGDLFLVLDDLEIGARSVDYAYSFAAAAKMAMAGGTGSLKFGYDDDRPGTSRFTTDLLLPGRLEARVAQWSAEANYIHAIGEAEGGVYAALRRTEIPDPDKLVFERFEAQTLRGSVGYGRRLGDALTVLANAGMVSLTSGSLPGVRIDRPFLDAKLSWSPTGSIELSAEVGRDFEIHDVNDPVGEYVRSYGFAVAKRFGEKVLAKVAYRLSERESVFYIYDTHTDEVTAELSWRNGERLTASLEYGFIRNRELDSAADYSGHQVSAGIEGRF